MPRCAWPDAPMLAIVSYPTLEESEAHIDSLTESEKASLARRKQFLGRFEGGKLKSPSDLPDGQLPRIVLSWDFDEDKQATVIKHEDRIIWSEAAVWEGAERFVEVVGILKEKYGRRLYDVVPTDASGLYLYADRLSSIGAVERTRANIRAGRPQLPG